MGKNELVKYYKNIKNRYINHSDADTQLCLIRLDENIPADASPVPSFDR